MGRTAAMSFTVRVDTLLILVAAMLVLLFASSVKTNVSLILLLQATA